MGFKVSARTILQLGAELISSDAVAFYELIKNAFDAGSPRVEINVVTRIPHNSITVAQDMLAGNTNKSNRSVEPVSAVIKRVQEMLMREIDTAAPNAGLIADEINKMGSLDDFKSVLDEANYIDIVDTGEGMSLRDLNDIYLTIGTRSRLEQREKSDFKKGTRPILGEKGLGRLSSMRLGNRLEVITSTSGEPRWNVLEVDWTLFSNASAERVNKFETTGRSNLV